VFYAQTGEIQIRNDDGICACHSPAAFSGVAHCGLAGIGNDSPLLAGNGL
jgi:hypothetical protein